METSELIGAGHTVAPTYPEIADKISTALSKIAQANQFLQEGRIGMVDFVDRINCAQGELTDGLRGGGVFRRSRRSTAPA